eukprot:12049584-Alexandrium_andersonii.AAC.1
MLQATSESQWPSISAACALPPPPARGLHVQPGSTGGCVATSFLRALAPDGRPASCAWPWSLPPRCPGPSSWRPAR